jgi:hypothetical protein
LYTIRTHTDRQYGAQDRCLSDAIRVARRQSLIGDDRAALYGREVIPLRAKARSRRASTAPRRFSFTSTTILGGNYKERMISALGAFADWINVTAAYI